MIRSAEFWVLPADAVQRLRLLGATLLEKLSRESFGNIEVGPLGQPA